MDNQLRLNLNRQPRYGADDFVVSAANAAAASLVTEDWQAWPGRALALIGPPGSGKTHLAHMWAQAVGAQTLAPPLAESPVGYMLIEDADQWSDSDGLFHLLNSLQAGSALLLTARTPPTQWPAQLPDLRSRLNALTTAELGAPDETILAGVLAKFFDERNIRPAPDLIPYLLTRIDRSVDAARLAVAQLDEAAALQRREVNRTLAVQVLAVDSVTRDLFDGET